MMRLVEQNAAVVIYASRTVLPVLPEVVRFENITVKPLIIENCMLPVYQECLIFKENFVFSKVEQQVVDLIIRTYPGD